MPYGFLYGMALLEQNKALHHSISQIFLLSIPCQQTMAAHALNTDCLATSNGVCNKKRRPILGCCCSKIITPGHVHLFTSFFLFQDSASIVNYEYEQNGKFQFWLHWL